MRRRRVIGDPEEKGKAMASEMLRDSRKQATEVFLVRAKSLRNRRLCRSVWTTGSQSSLLLDLFQCVYGGAWPFICYLCLDPYACADNTTPVLRENLGLAPCT